jgi:hypothetical protein
MNRRLLTVTLGIGLAAGGAAPAEAQLWFHPDYAVPSAGDTPSTFLAVSYGRGLNDGSGKADAYAVSAGKTGEKVSFMAGIGLVDLGTNEPTIGGAVGVDVVNAGSTTVSVQGGIGWMSFDFGTVSTTNLKFPLGVALKGSVVTSEATITPWVMPKINIMRSSADGASTTDTDLGASAGLNFNFQGGFGVHTALDIISGDGGESVLFGMGGHYTLGGG